MTTHRCLPAHHGIGNLTAAIADAPVAVAELHEDGVPRHKHPVELTRQLHNLAIKAQKVTNSWCLFYFRLVRALPK